MFLLTNRLFFYPDLLASYLLVIESFSNVALWTIPHLVLIWLILWTKIGDCTPFGLCFSFRHIINNTDFYHSYLVSLPEWNLLGSDSVIYLINWFTHYALCKWKLTIKRNGRSQRKELKLRQVTGSLCRKRICPQFNEAMILFYCHGVYLPHWFEYIHSDHAFMFICFRVFQTLSTGW